MEFRPEKIYEKKLQTVPENTSLDVCVRIRPLIQDEIDKSHPIIDFKTSETTVDFSASLKGMKSPKSWTMKGFSHILLQDQLNIDVYNRLISQVIPKVLEGHTACVFAFGHTSSGKSHTLIGYREEKGLVSLAIDQLLAGLAENGLSLQLSSAEIYQNKVYDLLGEKGECTVREGHDGMFHIRGHTSLDDKGRVIVNPLTFQHMTADRRDELQETMHRALSSRAVGSSSLHDESSRSHALIELQIVNDELVAKRKQLIVEEGELARCGKISDQIHVDIDAYQYTRDPVTREWIVREPKAEDVAAFKAADSITQEQTRVVEALQKEVEDLISDGPLGGTLVLLDLAGSEYGMTGAVPVKQQREARAINKSLLALKECIRGIHSKQKHIPFRNSTLTMLLRRYLLADNSHTTMITTVSSSRAHLKKTVNTLRYAELVAGK
eukprot:gnl/Dysnectes_brevis/3825_a4926_354.p1 GENE.gnl/Dysnectes_brevis/3825_a4926_354~~gnl/Dysnectes_brevis/3825_a4926_354.p1  ORF type:complete len:438 (-),score=115.43 gnl/Dysnectes_brevis/3825_a4926_354:1321-2634(-)